MNRTYRSSVEPARLLLSFLVLASFCSSGGAEGLRFSTPTQSLQGEELPLLVCFTHLLQTPAHEAVTEILKLDRTESAGLLAAQKQYDIGRQRLREANSDSLEGLLTTADLTDAEYELKLTTFMRKTLREQGQLVREIVREYYRTLDDPSRKLFSTELRDHVCAGVSYNTDKPRFDDANLETFRQFREDFERDLATIPEHQRRVNE